LKKGIFSLKNLAETLFDNKLSGKRVTTILLIIGLAGIALIFLSDFFHSDSTNTQTNQSSSSAITDSLNAYETQTQSALDNIIGSISGVGRVKVLVTVESGVENIYETDNKQSTEKTGGDDNSTQAELSSSSESSHVILNNNNGGEQALLKKQIQPTVLGVVVVCDGGSNPDVQESVVNTVSCALGLATNKITVLQMQKKQS
jgi:stage III sporulation protein AG